MVSRPELKEDTNYVNGLAAAILFVVLAAVFLTAGFSEPAGFAEGASLVAGIGYALIGLRGSSPVPVEGFLSTFEIVDLVLVGAVVASVMLASRQRDDEDSLLTALTDGGRTEPRDEEVEN